MEGILEKAERVYGENFPPVAWYGRCIFLSWYCDVGTCSFCFRSTQKHKLRYASSARRSAASVVIEALLCRKLGWRIEFLTGGYRIFPDDRLVELVRLVSLVYGSKLWVNLGAVDASVLERLKPYIEGVVASIECINPVLHEKICPDKPIGPYERMLSLAEGLKKSATIIIGLGETREDFPLLADFIRRNSLDRITFYVLKPVKGTPFEKAAGPSAEEYLWWIASTRVSFPKLEIIAGTTPRRFGEVGMLMRAGANAFTKFPATRMFGSPAAQVIESGIASAGRRLIGSITAAPPVDWDAEVAALGLDAKLECEVREKLPLYLSRMGLK